MVLRNSILITSYCVQSIIILRVVWSRCSEPECNVHIVADRSETARHFNRAGAEIVQVCDPRINLALPQQLAAEGVAGNELTVRGVMNERCKPFVEYVEDTPIADDLRSLSGCPSPRRCCPARGGNASIRR